MTDAPMEDSLMGDSPVEDSSMNDSPSDKTNRPIGTSSIGESSISE